MVDLHTHSTASDGSLSPSALMAEAEKLSISAIALTDHDTIAGLKEGEESALARKIRFIPGIELEITWDQEAGGQFHLLGLGIDRTFPGLIEAVEELGRSREKRNLEIVDKMNEAGIEVSYEEIRPFSSGQQSIAPKGHKNSIGRPHFADYLIRKKLVKNREQAFSRYLARGKPFYAPKIGMEFEKALHVIHKAGGIAVLAHPMSLYVAWGKLPDLIQNFKEKGLDGLEAWHPTAKVASCKRLEELGKHLGLCITAGSDFHGEARPGRRLGITAGGKKIEDSVLSQCREVYSPSHK